MKCFLMGGPFDRQIMEREGMGPRTIILTVPVESAKDWCGPDATAANLPIIVYVRGQLMAADGTEFAIFKPEGDVDKRCAVRRLLDTYFFEGASQ
jgi:hypothetical protein